jgi:tellurite resistance protein TehA-like permease
MFLKLTFVSIVVLGKLAKDLFPVTNTLPNVAHPGDVIYIFGFVVALILWGFAIVWFVVASLMIALVGSFPFNMGWWGFIFPVGQCAL